MMTKFAIDYQLFPQHHNRTLTHRTDDAVEAEEFIMHLLASGARIQAIRHEGVALSEHQFDRMLRVAAERTATLMLSNSLRIDSVEVKHRFGFAA